MKIKIGHKGEFFSNNILVADQFLSRLVGLMFKEKLHHSDGLMIDPCRSIHTFFMRYHLDIVFLSRDNQAIKIIRNLRPWRMTWIYLRATKTLEMPAGKLPLKIKEGDFLEVEIV